MPNLANLIARNSGQPSGVLATVRTPPDDPFDSLTVSWTAPGDQDVPEQDAGEALTAGQWVSNGRLPASGDAAILFLDSVGDPWAIVAGTGDPMWTAA